MLTSAEVFEILSPPSKGRPVAVREPGKRYRRRYSKRYTKRPEDGLPAPRALIEKIVLRIAFGDTLSRNCPSAGRRRFRSFIDGAGRQPSRSLYEVAKEARLDNLLFEMLELADNSVAHEKTRLQIAARKWMYDQLSRARPTSRKSA